MRRRQFVSIPAVTLAAEPSPSPTSWPVFDQTEEDSLTKVLRSGKWGRGNGTAVADFEARYAALTGTPHCLAVANGTSALLVALGVLGIGPGDEVIVPPYTFIATVNAVLRFHALPVFADVDPASMQMDPKRVAEQITPRTRAIIMVHMAGAVGELGEVLAIAKKHNIPVIEDAAQAHLAEWDHKHVGGHGAIGCFSFQASKNLNGGEGGAVVTHDAALAAKAFAFHNNSRGRTQPGTEFHYEMSGANLRLTEFQGALLTAQMSRIEKQSKRRLANAQQLDQLLTRYDGLTPCTVGKACTRNAYHLYMLRYEAAKFGGRKRAEFLRHMSQQGLSLSAGYSPLQDEPFLKNSFESRGYQFAYGKGLYEKWRKKNDCPVNRQSSEEVVWVTQTQLLSGPDWIPRMERGLKAWRG
ncbi:DegT/DnrJ/EryC1/StrS family aminotransferase [Bryobacter aggregatus]|uniref:DegT/DnrJ/EryC1/StrS family aminotransferase n=1 Tax=Bryobacter aggregatus TaxID=360054 RepID=UPI00068BE3AC|nr:DegT/DnrJ/EryC1/StrS family aminotransferase [Bryobacter aggregatus]